MGNNVTIGFSTTNKLISSFIREITKSPCSHAWIAFDSIDLETRVVVQAEWYGYEIIPLWRWRRNNILVAEFEPITIDLNPSLPRLAQYLGAKYDYEAAILSGLFPYFTEYMKRYLKSNFKDPSKLMCAESVIRLLQPRCDCVKDLDPELTTPKELLDTLFSTQEFKCIYKNPNFIK